MITLKTLHQATAQQVFDQVAKHLLVQNEKSEKATGGCQYRNPSGLKCAAGCLISDSEYNKGMEGKRWYSLVKNKLVSDQHIELIMELQDLHDTIEPVYWKIGLKEVAQRFYLKFYELENG